MQSSIRKSVVFSLCFLFVVSATIGIASKSFADQDMAHEPLPSSWKAESELTDVFFLNTNLGWAVGAQGVIVRTNNGGKTWTEISHVAGMTVHDMPLDQKIRNMRAGIRTKNTGIANSSSVQLPVRCRFESIHFVDEKYGWIAGGYKVPYVDRTRAVVMRTEDGGQSWQKVENLVVPRFHRIHFSDAATGWAIGESGNLFQSGIFTTADGGQTWSSQSTNRKSRQQSSWVDADETKSGFVAINYDGNLVAINGDQKETSIVLRDRGAKISNVKMADSNRGWAVGAAGTFLQTENGGLSWSQSVENADANLISKFDFRTVAISDSKTWFAGNPGSFLFCFDQQSGKTTSFRTPINSRINKIHFADDQSGWAVGDFGTIIATADGGQTWELQRGKNQRTAILCVAPHDQNLPLELLSKYASEESKICATLMLTGSETQNQIATQALERLGNTATISIESNLDSEANPNAVLERVVLSIRTLKPNIVVCNSGHMFATSEASPLENPVTLVQEAIRMAADTSAFSHQMEKLDLRTWQVERMAILDPTGTVTINPTRLLPSSGVLIEDQIAISRALVGQTIDSDRPLQYRVSHFTNRNRMRNSDLLSGLDTRQEIPSRGDKKNVRRGNLTMIQKANAKHKKFQQFANFEVITPQDFSVWQQQVQTFARSMEKEVAGVWVMQLADRYLRAGKPELAASAASLLVSNWPEHAFAPASLTWLAQYYASEEFSQIELRKRIEIGQLQQNGTLSESEKIRTQYLTQPKTIQQNGTSQMVWVPTQAMLNAQMEGDESEFQPTAQPESANGNPTDKNGRPAIFDARLKVASRFLSQLSQQDPELAAGPQYKLLEAQILRRLNGMPVNEGRFKSILQQPTEESLDVLMGAQRELGLHQMGSDSNSEVDLLLCQTTSQRPKLDGLLNESFWQDAMTQGRSLHPEVHPGLRLDNTDQATTDLVMFSYDDQFLYAGVVCQKIKGQYYNSRKQSRPRDADLTRRDRVELTFDLDRDYRSSNQFVIDHRGWVSESSTGSLGWNPDWYVSQSEDDSSWSVEIAIPLEQLVPNEIESGSAWAFKIARRAYDEQDLWSQSSTTSSLRRQISGMQIGLFSRPGEFELIRFVGSGESDGPDEAEANKNATIPASFESPIAPESKNDFIGQGQ